MAMAESGDGEWRWPESSLDRIISLGTRLSITGIKEGYRPSITCVSYIHRPESALRGLSVIDTG